METVPLEIHEIFDYIPADAGTRSRSFCCVSLKVQDGICEEWLPSV
ncbi:hypothetical protein ACPOL_4331 [Acidisarcina polymorpha]|uniref:Uncharacterized protein n=1 Tax=Acidisarcina polymorpha TaxID=2211140 RepID=A0A2Z5G4Z6_9BACT|nr:hypothetical protein ACPOL_4331 [Acidisarcina polymorpha]